MQKLILRTVDVRDGLDGIQGQIDNIVDDLQANGFVIQEHKVATASNGAMIYLTLLCENKNVNVLKTNKEPKGESTWTNSQQ